MACTWTTLLLPFVLAKELYNSQQNKPNNNHEYILVICTFILADNHLYTQDLSTAAMYKHTAH